jgi:hypothetical protein
VCRTWGGPRSGDGSASADAAATPRLTRPGPAGAELAPGGGQDLGGSHDAAPATNGALHDQQQPCGPAADGGGSAFAAAADVAAGRGPGGGGGGGGGAPHLALAVDQAEGAAAAAGGKGGAGGGGAAAAVAGGKDGGGRVAREGAPYREQVEVLVARAAKVRRCAAASGLAGLLAPW